MTIPRALVVSLTLLVVPATPAVASEDAPSPDRCDGQRRSFETGGVLVYACPVYDVAVEEDADSGVGCSGVVAQAAPERVDETGACGPGPAASGTGDADGLVAASGTGTADGAVGVSVLGDADGLGPAVSVGGDAEGDPAVTVLGDAEGPVAVSLLGSAEGEVAVGGCDLADCPGAVERLP